MIKFLCYPKCSTCKKAEKFLVENGIEYEKRDIKLFNPSEEEIKLWHEKSGLPIKKFFNTSGLVYRERNLKDKLKNMTDEEMYKELSTDGMLVKRPIIIGDDFVITGFKEEDWKNKILG